MNSIFPRFFFWFDRIHYTGQPITMPPFVIASVGRSRPLYTTLFQSHPFRKLYSPWRACSSATPESAPKKQNIVGLSADRLAEQLRQLDLKETVSSRTYTSIYNKGIMSFHDIPRTKISGAAATTLDEHFDIDIGTLVKEQNSDDGTQKWLIKFGKHQVESKS